MDSVYLDSSIRWGKLSNGMSYYIKKVPDPSDKVDLGLVVKVGHNHQESGEYEFAHIVEHLGFSAGKNISEEKSSKLFDQLGLGLSDLNGHTWNDYTDFKMVVPGNDEKAIDVALLFFQDIIYNLELTESSIDKERIAVFNERNRGTSSRTGISRYLERKMFGYEVMQTEEGNHHLTSFDSQALIQFYEKWYRPENMALVIVGNIENIEDLEEEIKRKFIKPLPVVEPVKMNHHRVQLPRESQFLKKPIPQRVEEPERRMGTLNLFVRDQVRERKNPYEDLKNDLKRKLFAQLMNVRHKEKQEAYNVDFSVRTEIIEAPSAVKSVIWFTGIFDEEVLKNVIEGFVEVEQNGFSKKEFGEEKENLIESINKQDTLSNFYWKKAIISHFVTGEALPSNKKKLEKTIIENLTLEEFNDEVKAFLKNQPGDITLAAHPGHPLLSYTEKDIRNLFAYFDDISIERYKSPQIPQALIDSVYLSELKETSYKEVETDIPGGRAFELENGLNIIMKSISKPSGEIEEKNKIYFQGIVETGVSHFPEEDFFTAMNVPAIVRNSGVGKLDKFEVERYLNANKFQGSVRLYIKDEEAGVSGSTSLEDLEKTLQLVHLYLAKPNFSEVAFEDWKKKEVKNLIMRQDTNKEDFLNFISDTLGIHGFFPRGSKALKGLKHTYLTRAKEIHNQIFQKPQYLTFLFSGNFEEQEVLDLCRKYLGNLPFSYNTENSFNKITLPESLIPSRIIVPSTKPMELAKVRLVYIPIEEIHDFDWKEEIKIEILRRSMTELVLRQLRFESSTGGTYLAAAGRYNPKTFNHHKVFITFDCKPQDTKRLIAESKELVDILKDKGPDEKLFSKIKLSMLSKINRPESHHEILQKMYDFERQGEKWVDPTEKQDFLKSLTANDILMTAEKYLNNDPFEFIMLPQEF